MYVQIPSNIFYFLFGVISTIIVLLIISYILLKKQQKKKQELTNMLLKNLKIDENNSEDE